jgi:hypothetical protein
MALTGSTVDLGRSPGMLAPPADAAVRDDYVGRAEDVLPQQARPSQLPKDELFKILQGWFRADATHTAPWRAEAKEMYDFRAGEQWNPEDRQVLNSQNRPEITFNRCLTILKAVAGMEINGRHEVHYIPRHNEDTAVNELLTGAGKWMTDECDAEDEESQAFDDANTCGMGWTEHRLDYELDRRGLYIEERVDPLEMYWDRNAKRKNLIDARRIARVRKIPLGDAMQLFRGKTRQQLDAFWAIGTEMDATQKTLEEKRKREENTTDTGFDDMFEVTIVNIQWWERENYWLVADPTTNQTMELSPEEYKQFTTLMKRMNQFGGEVQFMAVEMTRRVYKEAYLGGEILSLGNAALGQFKWTCITGEYNRTRGQWFGLIKVMKDPQMWANKWLSQSLHILNTTAKGGVMAEQDAFEDVREAEDKWARPDSIIWMKRGALGGTNPKVVPRPGGSFPTGHIQLMEFAISAIRDVTGINLELLGMKDQNQPGILEAQRKQAGMTVLATVFDSLRRFRKQGGRIRLTVIQVYLSDGRLIRIVGQQGAQAIPLLKDKCTGDYDVVIDDAPTSPNQKESNWAIIASLLPAFKDQLVQNPQLLVKVMKYSPLPAALVEEFDQLMQGMAPQQQQQQGLAQSAATAKINKDQAQAELFLAQAGKQESTAMYDIAIAMSEFMNAHNNADLSAAKAAHERVKAHVAAMTPIEPPANTAAAQNHERVMQASDQAHEARQQLGQQRFDLVSQLLQQQHERTLQSLQALQAGNAGGGAQASPEGGTPGVGASESA